VKTAKPMSIKAKKGNKNMRWLECRCATEGWPR
jgi:hypothetical protein